MPLRVSAPTKVPFRKIQKNWETHTIESYCNILSSSVTGN